ncbi:MAG TPA: phosphate ABC transporter permease PstA [Candidatus Krumholzibacteria bacterium]|nr:phosphate ABC transporter permease PstA [Candidatus Krumholzibacteria bacterium]
MSMPLRTPGPPRFLKRVSGSTSLLAHGENMIWLMGGALAVCALMVVGLLALVLWQGSTTFWAHPVERIELANGTVLMGEVTRRQTVGDEHRRLVRTGNFERTGTHFEWVSDASIATQSRPEWALVLERRAWGRFYGVPTDFRVDGKTIATGPEASWLELKKIHGGVLDRFNRRYHLQRDEFGAINATVERGRLQVLKAERENGKDSAEYKKASAIFEGEQRAMDTRRAALEDEMRTLDEENARYQLMMATAKGDTAAIAVAEIVRAYPANRLSTPGRIGVYGSRWKEFLAGEPREANSEGGVFPAIVGTIVMTLLMSIAVVPFGVLAALYLREYAKAGAVVSAVRIAINNLAGVPSIVFGVFGLGFFCYILGASIDRTFFTESLPNPTFGKGGLIWASLTLALLTLPVVVVATEEALAAVPRSMREGSYACGASKWQTIRRIVLPRAMPGIMTGFILAIARGAGEVAPLMLVGAVKLAPALPVDGTAPYVHPERSFMHLGFHIYDVGFQSQNSEAAKPMVFTTTLLLITIIALLNVAAIRVRTRLRRKFVGGTF